ncbi:DNA recombination protein RmuC [Thermasporomyces composti]|jgi:DNA recombination protein RmuC|uniref:DNA recombination protein RmuC n=1 Tax=Thermasporomyces composti TaxID=696763 RepID=A0A3D9V288_THECX|nr:DNA recombination protein RmuC [Thermasporomyces composti]REF35599.1 DNA recombination protein RmuC [Thermasporomyces composti]
MNATTFLTFLVGLVVGMVIGALLIRVRIGDALARATAERDAAESRLAELAADRRTLAEQVKAASADAMTQSSQQLLTLADARMRAAESVVAPVKESLDRFDARLRELEQSRVALEATLREQVDAVRLTGEALRRETGALATALRKPQVRGRWGELHLARAAELAGLVEHCDITFQHSTSTADGVHRPDAVVRLAGGKHIVIDAKVPLEAFLEAAEATDDEARERGLVAHARQVRAHVDALASKAYWRRLPATPEFVVLFMPGEAFLSHALEADPTLLEYAAERRVILATPSTLIALLRTVAYAWTEQSLTQNAREVFELGRELYERLGRLGRHLDRLGRSLAGAVGAYNEAIGSLETRVLVTARRLRDLKVTAEELENPTPVDQAVRPLAAAELVASAAEARAVRSLTDQRNER